METQTYHYEELTATQLADLDRERTLALMALSPLEVHGPHLPLGTDVLVALELQKRIVRQATERWPETSFLLLPPAFIGADTVPDAHSIDVDSRAVYHLLMATGRSLAAQGFRHLVLTDNHGGPRHQIAIEKAVRRLYRQHDFCLVAPFNRLYRRMVEGDPRLLADTGTGPGSCGDAADSHGGTNETSLMLIAAPGLILPLWKTLPRTAVPDNAGPRQLLASVAGLVGRLGKERLARDLAHLGSTLGWLAMKPMPTYMGAPAEAKAEAGERMLEAHAAEAIEMLEEVKAGKPPYSEPVLWGLRFIERS
jgi:creatinine amidohydrolase